MRGIQAFTQLGLIFFILSNSAILFAEPRTGHGAGHSEMTMKHAQGHSAKPRPHSDKKGGTFGPHWAKTLTDEQKISFDKMHLLVGQFEAVQRAKIAVLKAELSVLVATKTSNQSAIYKKIDEIVEVKKAIMRNRYDHIAEMRTELTDQQKISYDMDLLKPKKHKH